MAKLGNPPPIVTISPSTWFLVLEATGKKKIEEGAEGVEGFRRVGCGRTEMYEFDIVFRVKTSSRITEVLIK
jgi:hypothetical protein